MHVHVWVTMGSDNTRVHVIRADGVQGRLVRMWSPADRSSSSLHQLLRHRASPGNPPHVSDVTQVFWYSKSFLEIYTLHGICIVFISFAAYWISLDVNLFVQAVVLFGVVAAMDWKKETEKVS